MQRRYDPTRERWNPLGLRDTRHLVSGTPAWISGGVGIDLWLGRATRQHGDIDVSVTRGSWPDLLSRLPKWLTPYAARAGMLSPLVDGRLDDSHSVWCRDERAGTWRLQINLECGDDVWRYRRQRDVTLPWRVAVLEVAGTRVMSPEVQLLWKSRDPAPKDEIDRVNVLPLLAPDRRDWFRGAMERAHPQSPWLR